MGVSNGLSRVGLEGLVVRMWNKASEDKKGMG